MPTPYLDSRTYVLTSYLLCVHPDLGCVFLLFVAVLPNRPVNRRSSLVYDFPKLHALYLGSCAMRHHRHSHDTLSLNKLWLYASLAVPSLGCGLIVTCFLSACRSVPSIANGSIPSILSRLSLTRILPMPLNLLSVCVHTRSSASCY